jgi:hypothetical protein
VNTTRATYAPVTIGDGMSVFFLKKLFCFHDVSLRSTHNPLSSSPLYCITDCFENRNLVTMFLCDSLGCHPRTLVMLD